jgi:hypothetical protein
MEKSLEKLGPAELEVLARVKIAAVSRLAAASASSLPGLVDSRGSFSLRLSAPGIRGPLVRCRGAGPVEVAGGGRCSLFLRFPSPSCAALALSGGSAPAIPFFLAPGAFRALSFFRAAASGAQALLAAPGTPAELRARLLATAALAGLAEVASSDHAIAERMAHVPDGSVAVEAPGAFSLGLEKRGPRVLVLEAAPVSPNARLSFRDASSAVAVFTGKLPAPIALASGGVAIHGLLPLVQGLFTALDRLGEYLAVKPMEVSR